MSCYINYGSRRIDFKLPKGWNLIAQGAPSGSPGSKNVQEEVKRAFDYPEGSPKLEEMAKPGMKVVILFDDWARPTPAYLVFPEILKRLTQAGVKEQNMTAICARGTHISLSEEELKRKIGDEAYHRLSPRVFNHDPFSKENVVIGRTSRGTLVEVNSTALDADLLIGIGTCIPHHYSGFGGGAKIIMPGISSAKAVAEHHMKWLRNPRVRIGELDANPFHQEQNEYAKMVRLDFKIDFVLNEKNQVVKVYCGDVFAEHKKAAAESIDMYTFRVPKLSDVTVVSAYPLEQHLPQTSKGLNAASHVTKAGGHIIFTATNEEPEKFLALVDVVSSMPSALQYHRDLLEGHYNPPCPPYGLDFHVVCHLYKAILEKFSRIVYITDGLNKNQVEGMGFTYAPSMEEALSLVNSEVSNPDVTVFPAGGITLPILEHCS